MAFFSRFALRWRLSHSVATCRALTEKYSRPCVWPAASKWLSLPDQFVWALLVRLSWLFEAVILFLELG